ncbi:MAG: hypothetical protein EON54_18615 [Alcaligenaceae bacterium]|nr:MAG: hypothetical protein EON54_18615 [Alcaligenaceae bacterium]
MSIFSVFIFVCGAAASQALAQAVKASLPAGKASSWCWAVLLQYLVCVGLLLVIDKAAIGDALDSAVALTFFIRWVCFMKNLKAT